jgi:hypothetical protein
MVRGRPPTGCSTAQAPGAEARQDPVELRDRHVLHHLRLARLLARATGAVLGEDHERAVRDHRLQQRGRGGGHLLQGRGERVVQAVEHRDGVRHRQGGGVRRVGLRDHGGMGGRVGRGGHPGTLRPSARTAGTRVTRSDG